MCLFNVHIEENIPSQIEHFLLYLERTGRLVDFFLAKIIAQNYQQWFKARIELLSELQPEEWFFIAPPS